MSLPGLSAAALILCALLALVQPAFASKAGDLKDHLAHRWFEIEIIVFERLDVLDVNNAEQLTLTTRRYWPHNLLEIEHLHQSQDRLQPTNPLTEVSPFCLGYPALAEIDAIHPSFVTQPGLPQAEDLEPIEDDLVLVDENLVEDEGQLPPPTPPQPIITPYLQVLADLAAFERNLADSSYLWLEQLTLEAEVKAINRQSRLRPLIHRRWRQPVPARDEPQPVYLAAVTNAKSPLTQSGMPKLEGHVAVTVGRYLHLAATLWYHADNLGLAPVPLPISILANSAQPPSRVDARPHMVLHESRRMRSGDLHYLDHPKFGVIVRIDPIEIPHELNQAWQALAETPQDSL